MRIRYCGVRDCLHKSVWRNTLFSPPTLGLTIRVESRRQRCLLQTEIRKAVKRSVVARLSFDRFLPPTHPNAQERGDLWARVAMVSVGTRALAKYGE